jgi:hypothetical protein
MMKYDMLAHLTMLLESGKVFAVTGNLAGFNPRESHCCTSACRHVT